MSRSRLGWWHGWTNTLADGAGSVVSQRLEQDQVANRWFPKIRSWIRLGAPIELLSPLSVARILALVSLATWPAMILVAGLPPVVGGALAAASLVSTLVLLRQSALSARMCTVTLATALVSVVAAIGLATGERRALITLVMMLVTSLFVGLFMRVRPLFATIAAATTALPVVARLTGERVGFSGAIVVALVSALTILMSGAMARASRQAGATDADTGVPNARGLRQQLGQITGPTVVATVRLVGVAAARDALGHDAGSELIRRAIEDLGQVIDSDARVGRGADDEVVVIVPANGSIDQTVHTTGGWVEAAIGHGSYLVGDVEVVLDAHVGLAVGDADIDDLRAGDEPLRGGGINGTPGSIRDALRHSALAARQAEEAGEPWRLWDGQQTTLTVDDLSLLADLRGAADRGELWIAYQPQVRTPDGAVSSVEALIRWTHPERGFVSPGRFIPLAERTGLIDRLTDWVLGEALDAQVRWRPVGHDVSVSVNVSPLSLRRLDFANRVSAEVQSRGLPPSALTLEVTESTAFDVPQAVERLAPLRALGVRIAIDDFGTGYTSLAILPELPLDEIKIDQKFVRDVFVSPASDAIVRSMCELAHRLELLAVAEGAEDAAIVDHLTVAGYDLIQGYFFAKPMSEEQLLAWLLERRLAGSGSAGDTGVSFVGPAHPGEPSSVDAPPAAPRTAPRSQPAALLPPPSAAGMVTTLPAPRL
ncbi:MAG: bifunctional diguanylate cyclase/phosphodiesterase [Actinomycetota bacterium]